MKRWGLLTVVGIAATWLISLPSGATVKHGQHVTDKKYGISFNLPSTWKQPSLVVTSTGSVKLEVLNRFSSTSFGIVQVEPLAGRNVSAAGIAAGIREESSASALANVTGSEIVKLPFGKAEQLTFTLQIPNSALIYGTVEGFYLNRRTYYVFVSSPSASVASTALKTVMASWGS